jgi:uncharacterized DUF497 family protein
VDEAVFQWDERNLGWLWRRHRVTSEQAEQAFSDPHQVPVMAYGMDTEQREASIGMADGPRLLHIVWTEVQTESGSRIRLIHARNATRHEAGLYFGQ